MRGLSLLMGLVVLVSACTSSNLSTDGSTTTTSTIVTTEVISTSTTATAEEPVPTTGEGTTPEAAGPEATSDLIIVGEPIQLAPTHFVVGVDQDDVLNGRFGPGVGSNINAEIDPGYGTVRVKGSEEEVPDGGLWTSVAYSPATQLVWDQPDAPPHGWVNSAYLAPIDGWLPPGGPCDLETGIADVAGDSASSADEILDVIAVDLGDCVRIVVTFAENVDGAHLGVTLPPIGAAVTDEFVLRISVPVDSVLPHATDVFGGDYAALVSSRPGDGLWIHLALPGTASVRGIHETGQLVIDMMKGDVSEIFVRDGTIVALPPVQTPTALHFVGYARPFEATLVVTIGEADGDAVFPEYVTGSAVVAGGQAVMTGGWLDVWGIYEFAVEGLPPGDYQVVIADNTAVEEGFPVVRFLVAVP